MQASPWVARLELARFVAAVAWHDDPRGTRVDGGNNDAESFCRVAAEVTRLSYGNSHVTASLPQLLRGGESFYFILPTEASNRWLAQNLRLGSLHEVSRQVSAWRRDPDPRLVRLLPKTTNHKS